MKKKRLLALLFPLMLVSLPHAYGLEDQDCRPRSAMIDALIDEYGQQLAEVHEIKGRGLLKFHISPDEGTWTALLTNEGVSCVVAVGEDLDPAKSEVLTVGLRI